jgi:single-strand DNA-binding protein
MATGLNRITIIGNLGHNPELRYAQSGTPICTLRVGVTERRKEGETWQDHTDWFAVVCFGKNAENAAKYLQKGRQVYAEGRLQTREWQDREGKTRFSLEIVCNELRFLGGGAGRGADNDMEMNNSMGAGNGGRGFSGDFNTPNSLVNDDDIPF